MANMLKLALGGFTEWQGTPDGAGKVVLYDENGNPMEVATEATLAALQSELALVKGELATIMANQTSGDQKVQVSGNITELFGKDLSARPSASSVGVGTTFMIVGDAKVYQSNGTDWVVLT